MNRGNFKSIRLAITIIMLAFASAASGSYPTATELPAVKAKTVYLFSGLGADSTPFMNLRLPGYKIVYIHWVTPLANEPLANYALRIREQITVEKPYFVGLSFGGVLAVEISKIMEIDKMVLISSVKTKHELNQVQNFFMRMGLYRIIPGFFLKQTNFLTNSYFGAHTERDKKTLMRMLQGTDIPLFRWGLKSIANWDNEQEPPHTVQIHGNADRVISPKFVHPDYTIKGGGHLMVYNRADTISKIILGYFKDR